MNTQVLTNNKCMSVLHVEHLTVLIMFLSCFLSAVIEEDVM
jgi:hypothetical protein